MSSDTDLVPAVEEIRSFGKMVQYIGIPKGQSFGLSKITEDVRLLKSKDIERFFIKPPSKKKPKKVTEDE